MWIVVCMDGGWLRGWMERIDGLMDGRVRGCQYVWMSGCTDVWLHVCLIVKMDVCMDV